jgi:hypothetical protein
MIHGTTGCAIFALLRLERMADIRAVVCITGNADCGNANGYQIEPNRWALGGLVDAAPTRGSARQKLVHLIASPVSEDKIAAVAILHELLCRNARSKFSNASPSGSSTGLALTVLASSVASGGDSTIGGGAGIATLESKGV